MASLTFTPCGEGKSSRSAFRIRLAQEKDPATFIVFDILEYMGKDLTDLPLVKRREKAEGLQRKRNRRLFPNLSEKGKNCMPGRRRKTWRDRRQGKKTARINAASAPVPGLRLKI